jgi:UDP-N-acetyl-2-amino-2-deoxyglucuronate dehydrogenase
MDKVKFAVVGLGNIGTRHMAILSSHPGVQVSAICDVQLEKCKKYDLAGGIRSFADFDRMLEQCDADVVDICTPHHLHAEMAIKAANSGKNILVEKPMALTTSEANQMIAVAAKNKVRLFVVKQNRYNVPVVLTNQVLQEGRLGQIFMAQCNVFWNRNPEYYSESDWRGIKMLEKGALFTQASHFIDLMIWWFGDVTKAAAQIATRLHRIEIEDCGVAQVEFSSGVMGSINWTTCVHDKNYEGCITIIGEKGTIKIGGQYLNKIEFWDVPGFPIPDSVQFNDRPNSYGKYQGSSSNHDKVINDVVNDLLYDQNNSVYGDQGLKTVRAIELIYENAVIAAKK